MLVHWAVRCCGFSEDTAACIADVAAMLAVEEAGTGGTSCSGTGLSDVAGFSEDTAWSPVACIAGVAAMLAGEAGTGFVHQHTPNPVACLPPSVFHRSQPRVGSPYQPSFSMVSDQSIGAWPAAENKSWRWLSLFAGSLLWLLC